MTADAHARNQLQDRLAIADQVRSLSTAAAEEVTDTFLRRHPDWIARYGERARLRGVEDARYHLTFLASALEAGSAGAFDEYARWTARVLGARGIDAAFLVENLNDASDALARRMPSEWHPLVDEYVQSGIRALDAVNACDIGPPTPDQATSRAVYLQAILAGERKAALTVVTEALREGVTLEDIYVDVLQASLYEVGRLWEANRITVAHEHAATAITQFVMANLYERVPRRTDGRGTVLITGLEGELHSVGANMVADVLEMRGLSVHFLGTNLPARAILDSIRERQPDCVGISATMLFSVATLRHLIDAVRQEWGRSKRIVLGGGAFRHAPGLWQELGADGHAGNVREAVDLLCPV